MRNLVFVLSTKFKWKLRLDNMWYEMPEDLVTEFLDGIGREDVDGSFKTCLFKARRGTDACLESDVSSWGFCEKHKKTVQSKSVKKIYDALQTRIPSTEESKVETSPKKTSPKKTSPKKTSPKKTSPTKSSPKREESTETKKETKSKSPVKTQENDDDTKVANTKDETKVQPKYPLKTILVKNRWGNFEHSDSKIVFNPNTQQAFGVQRSDGSIYSLDPARIDICVRNGWKYLIPEGRYIPDGRAKNLKTRKIGRAETRSPDFVGRRQSRTQSPRGVIKRSKSGYGDVSKKPQFKKIARSPSAQRSPSERRKSPVSKNDVKHRRRSSHESDDDDEVEPKKGFSDRAKKTRTSKTKDDVDSEDEKVNERSPSPKANSKKSRKGRDEKSVTKSKVKDRKDSSSDEEEEKIVRGSKRTKDPEDDDDKSSEDESTDESTDESGESERSTESESEDEPPKRKVTETKTQKGRKTK